MECVLRTWRMEDAPELARTISCKRVQDNLRDGLPYPYTAADGEAFIAAMLSAGGDRVYAFAVTVEDRAVGSIALTRCENIHARTAELGYYIGEAYWGRGLATSAVRQACEFAFAHTDLIRIFAEPFAYNAASCRVLEKAGFQLEGTLRKNAVKNGRILDMKLYARLADGLD